MANLKADQSDIEKYDRFSDFMLINMDYQGKSELNESAVRKQMEFYRARTSELEDYIKHLQQLNQGLMNQLVDLRQERKVNLEMLTHDVRSTLSVILGNTQLGRMEGFSKRELGQFFGEIEACTKHIHEVINNVSDLFLLEGGEMELITAAIDLRLIIGDVVNRYSSAARRKEIFLHFIFPDHEYLVEGDSYALTTIVDNLVSNAIKFSPVKTRIYIRLFEQDEMVACEVQDEGQGLTTDDMEKLFQKFARLSARPTANEFSTGLGLSIVKQLVEAMNGVISVESKGRDQGACFRVEFPKKG